jgi:hypothetical protein
MAVYSLGSLAFCGDFRASPNSSARVRSTWCRVRHSVFRRVSLPERSQCEVLVAPETPATVSSCRCELWSRYPRIDGCNQQRERYPVQNAHEAE